jgi:FtsZ-interacting cell division protein ZipA|tara:strand:- start:863 stop:1042 length:180 start_codon:yes stop_codon:yes gene_type:complete
MRLVLLIVGLIILPALILIGLSHVRFMRRKITPQVRHDWKDDLLIYEEWPKTDRPRGLM